MHSNSTNDIKYKLDLHGETREKAIQKLISFLDQIRYSHKHHRTREKSHHHDAHLPNSGNQIMIAVVTGSGSHSQGGPILRTAVETVLKKRQMTYHLTHKKGAFHVDALSGIELSFDYEQGLDSKVVLVNDDHDFTLLRHTAHRSKSNAVYKPKLTSNSASDGTESRKNLDIDADMKDILSEHDNPSPSEVARDDQNLKKAKELSLRDVATTQSIKGKESHEFQKAMQLSIQSKRDQDELELEENERMIADAIELSKQSMKNDEVQKGEEDFDRELNEVMELSKKEYSSFACHVNDSQQAAEQEALEYAIRMSQRDAMVQKTCANQIAIDDNEERLLQMALEMSKVECQKDIR